MYVRIHSIATGKKELQLTCNHFGKKFLSSRDTRLEGDSIPSQSITQLNGSICCWWGLITSSSRHKAGEETWRCHKKRKWKDKDEKQYISHIRYQKEKYTPSLGMMFFTMKASQAPGVKTSFQGCKMRRAEVSLGCHLCKALASLLLIGG